MNQLAHFSNISEAYNAFLVDLWGVVHDGTRMYAGAGECLRQLKAAGKPVVFISNAPRRAEKAAKVLDTLGVTRDLYAGIVTSGEVGFSALKARASAAYYFIGPERDADVLDGLEYKRVELAEADFILNVGFGSEQDGVANVTAELKAARERNLPMVCLNPDLEVVKISGERFACAGAIALEYEAMGGAVEWFGKPYPAIYEACLKLLPARRILAIGDSLRTDIAGANAAGLDCLLIKGGILKGQEIPANGPQPTYSMDEWVW